MTRRLGTVALLFLVANSTGCVALDLIKIPFQILFSILGGAGSLVGLADVTPSFEPPPIVRNVRGDQWLVSGLTRDAPKKPRAYDAWFADLEKRGVALAFAWLVDGETPLVEKAAEKAKVPLVVLSPEETRPDLDPNRAVFWAGGIRAEDEALYAMD